MSSIILTGNALTCQFLPGSRQRGRPKPRRLPQYVTFDRGAGTGSASYHKLDRRFEGGEDIEKIRSDVLLGRCFSGSTLTSAAFDGDLIQAWRKERLSLSNILTGPFRAKSNGLRLRIRRTLKH
jgi:hypothetical protein